MTPTIEVRQAKLAWWNWAMSITPYIIVLHGTDAREHMVENPDAPGTSVTRVLRIPPFLDRYGAEVVAKKATDELEALDPEEFARRWKVPLAAVRVRRSPGR